MSGLDTPWGEDIRIDPMPVSGKPFNAVKAVKIDNTTVILGVDGKLYCPRLGKNFWYPISQWPWAPGLMKGLVALGKITKKQEAQYAIAAKIHEKQQSAGYDLDKLDELIKTYGIKISSRERAKLVKAAGR